MQKKICSSDSDHGSITRAVGETPLGNTRSGKCVTRLVAAGTSVCDAGGKSCLLKCPEEAVFICWLLKAPCLF